MLIVSVLLYKNPLFNVPIGFSLPQHVPDITVLFVYVHCSVYNIMCVCVCAACIRCHVRNAHLYLLPSLECNNISDEGVRVLGDALKVNTTLKSLE